MSKSNQYKRLLDKNAIPDEEILVNTIGQPLIELWNRLKAFLDENYDFQPELHYYGLKYGWCYKYRRKNKTLCVLFPETGAFTVLVTLGKKEIEKIENNINSFNRKTQRVFNEAYQYHDGKWVYRRVLNGGDLEDVIAMIKIKKRPKK